MSGVHDFALFVAAGLLLNFTPGADTLYIVARSTSQGFRAGAMAALGIGAGCLVHIAAATFGLSALLAASATAFTVVKLAGAVYLVYLGITLWPSSRRTQLKATPPPPASLRKVFAQGVVTNVLNPKVALFFLSFLPQFIDPAAPGKLAAFLLLGLVFDFNATAWNLLVAYVSARVAGRPLRSAALATWLRRVVAGTFVCLGLRLALSSQR
jgi:threonine/homoserine/homoserine lactone efflux protein